MSIGLDVCTYGWKHPRAEAQQPLTGQATTLHFSHRLSEAFDGRRLATECCHLVGNPVPSDLLNLAERSGHTPGVSRRCGLNVINIIDLSSFYAFLRQGVEYRRDLTLWP